MFVKRLLRVWHKKPCYFHIARVINVVLSLPIRHRKIVITSCQTWEVDRETYETFYMPNVHDIHTYSLLSTRDFLKSLEYCVARPSQASIIWMVCRTCPEPPDADEHLQVAQDGFNKEIIASQETFSYTSKFQYSGFFAPSPPSFSPMAWWTTQMHEIRDEFHARMHHKTLYPQINRTKNVSDETSALYQIYLDQDYVRTVDLEVLYAKTGVRVPGNCELRDAWKFNDLKPRMYYAIGGQQYWSSRYVKSIAVAIMEAIPSAFSKIRVDPTQYLSSVWSEDFVVAWDFTSFTTTLSELKYFIWSLARASENKQTVVTLFDYHLGFVDRQLSEMLDEYNEVANMNAPFEVHRMVGKYLEVSESTFFQANSGMLGVPGNIGFSTALHGLVVCKECGQKRCVCVGDDALGIIPTDPTKKLLPALSVLGHIHPEKFSIIHPSPQPGESIKFLKRRMERVGNLFIMNFLLNIPVSAYIDGIVGFRTTPPDFSLEARIFKFVTHCSSLLWEVYHYGNRLDDRDVDIIFDFLGEAYKSLRLPFRGMFPGHTLFGGTPDELVVGYSIPCIRDFDPRRKDWLDHLLDTSPQDYFRGPIMTPRCYDYDIASRGDSGMLAESVWVSAMEDMGYYKVTPVMEWFRVSDVSSKRLLKRIVRHVDDGMVKATFVQCLNDIPLKYRPRKWVVSTLVVDIAEI